MKHICVFCGSYTGEDREYRMAAEAVGRGIIQRKMGLIYGGGHVGLMGTVADAAMAAGGPVTGVIPSALAQKELAHTGLTELVEVRTMHERKALMADRADAFLALPGGFGTMDELFEIITWAQLGFHRKPIALLNVKGFFDPLLVFIDHLAEEGFIKPEHRQVLLVGTKPDDLLDTLMTYEPPLVDKWVERDDL
jgi:uncharacterized protein (TIGR00730 family)